jgi:hypothetical protein
MKASELACGIQQRVELVSQTQMRVRISKAQTEHNGADGSEEVSRSANHESYFSTND